MTAFDLPGHGRSAPWDDRGEMQGVTAEIAADFCGGPMDVIGHSFGATVALRLAVTRPELVRSLTLIEPVFFAVALADRPDLRQPFEAQTQGFTKAMSTGDLLAAAREFTKLWGGGVSWDDVSETQQQGLADQMTLVQAGSSALYDDVGGMLEPGVLETLQVPVLLIEGSKSPAIIPAINSGLAGRLQNTSRAVIMGAAHMVPISHPAQVSAEVLRFLSTTGQG